MESGKLFGLETESRPTPADPQTIVQIRPDSWASANKIQLGQKIVSITEQMVDGPSRSNSLAAPAYEATVQVDNRQFQIAAGSLPRRSMPVHPSQIYAAVSGLILCGWTLLFSTFAKRTGVVIGVGLIAYGVQRIIEEIIRVDEAGQFGTSLSIAQWISMGGIVLGLGLVICGRTKSFARTS